MSQEIRSRNIETVLTKCYITHRKIRFLPFGGGVGEMSIRHGVKIFPRGSLEDFSEPADLTLPNCAEEGRLKFPNAEISEGVNGW